MQEVMRIKGGPMNAKFVVLVAFALGSSAQGQVGTSRQSMTITGCVGREVDVLRTSPGNLGLADEFVLIRPSAKQEMAARVYRLSGDLEKQLKDRVGQQVEITASFDSDDDARLEAARDEASAKAAKTPDRRPEAKDVPKMTIQSIHPLGTTCAAPGRK